MSDRPNRKMSDTGPEQTAVRTWADGRQTRLTMRQVGWIGQTGDFYSLNENPARTERGGYRPLWFVAHDEAVPAAEFPSRWRRFALLLRFGGAS